MTHLVTEVDDVNIEILVGQDSIENVLHRLRSRLKTGIMVIGMPGQVEEVQMDQIQRNRSQDISYQCRPPFAHLSIQRTDAQSNGLHPFPRS